MAINVTKPSVNLREKLNELETNKGLKGNEILQAETAQEVRSLIGAGRKNLLINGGFDVWQRGTSFSGGNNYHADRTVTYMDTRADSALVRSTDVPSGERFKYSCKLTTTQSHGHPFYRQRIEDFSTLVKNTKTYTISFWAKASVSMTISSDLGDASSQTHSLTTTWTKFTNTVAVGTSYTYDAVDLQANSTAGDIYITGVQLELGSVATDFEHRSYGEELALCQRYYQRLRADGLLCNATSTGLLSVSVPFPTTLRATPTITIDFPDRVTQFDVADKYITPTAFQISRNNLNRTDILLKSFTSGGVDIDNTYVWNSVSNTNNIYVDAEL